LSKSLGRFNWPCLPTSRETIAKQRLLPFGVLGRTLPL
jgi:hypothetical protein